jgi:hypothetical protein
MKEKNCVCLREAIYINLFFFIAASFLKCASTHAHDIPSEWFWVELVIAGVSLTIPSLCILYRKIFVASLIGIPLSILIYFGSAIILITYDDTCNERAAVAPCWSLASLTFREAITVLFHNLAAVWGSILVLLSIRQLFRKKA